MNTSRVVRTLLVLTEVTACMTAASCRASEPTRSMPPEQQKRFEALRDQATEASMTVFPIEMGHNAAFNKDAGTVLAALLEQAGMKNLHTTDEAFRGPKEAQWDQVVEQFGEYVQKHSIKTDYALDAQIIGSGRTGVQEIRGVIVDRAGNVVWVDRQTASDPALKRAKPNCPMDCCQFLAERVRKQLGIPRSARDTSGKGRIARMMASQSPGPGDAEREAMAKRVAAMKKAGPGATVAVLPVRIAADATGEKEGHELATLLNQDKLCHAIEVNTPLTAPRKRSYNEQETLWDFARTVKAYVEAHPPTADYVLMADYIMRPGGKGAWEVHFVVCDRSGEWVIVDFQNDHHRDFKRIDPKTYDDCAKLVAKRFEGYLR